MVASKAKNLPALLAQAEQAGAVAALAAARLFNAAGGHDNEPKILKPFRNGYIYLMYSSRSSKFIGLFLLEECFDKVE